MLKLTLDDQLVVKRSFLNNHFNDKHRTEAKIISRSFIDTETIIQDIINQYIKIKDLLAIEIETNLKYRSEHFDNCTLVYSLMLHKYSTAKHSNLIILTLDLGQASTLKPVIAFTSMVKSLMGKEYDKLANFSEKVIDDNIE